MKDEVQLWEEAPARCGWVPIQRWVGSCLMPGPPWLPDSGISSGVYIPAILRACLNAHFQRTP